MKRLYYVLLLIILNSKSIHPEGSNRDVAHDKRGHRLAVWDFEKRKIIARPPRHQNSRGFLPHPLIAAISSDGRLVASGAFDGTVRIWDIESRQELGEIGLNSLLTRLAFDPSGQFLAAATEDGRITVIAVSKVSTGKH